MAGTIYHLHNNEPEDGPVVFVAVQDRIVKLPVTQELYDQYVAVKMELAEIVKQFELAAVADIQAAGSHLRPIAPKPE